MSELQVGMLALVTGSYYVPGNIGKVVTLSRFVRNEEIAISGPCMGDRWIIEGDGVGYMKGDTLLVGNIGLSAAEFLMPIKPEADPLDVTHKEELHA